MMNMMKADRATNEEENEMDYREKRKRWNMVAGEWMRKDGAKECEEEGKKQEIRRRKEEWSTRDKQQRSRGLFRSLSDPSISQRKTGVYCADIYCSVHTERWDFMTEQLHEPWQNILVTKWFHIIHHIKPMTPILQTGCLLLNEIRKLSETQSKDLWCRMTVCLRIWKETTTKLDAR